MKAGRDRRLVDCPEGQLLLDLLRAALGTTDGDRGGKSQQEPLNWDRLLDFAHRNAVIPLVSAGIKRSPGVLVPEWVADRLEQRTRRVALRNLFLAGELRKLIGLFESHGVRAIAFKGPTLAVRAYGDLSSREFLDLDLLIPPSEIGSAVELAAELRYRCVFPVPSRDIPMRLRRCRQIPLVRSDGLSTAELHTDFTSPGFSYRRDFDALWHTRGQVELCGKLIPVLTTEELLLFLCVHGGKHVWERLAWICDVAALIAAQTSIDWDYVLKRASQTHVERLLLLAMRLAEEIVGVPGARECQGRIASDPVLERLAATVRKRLLGEGRGPSRRLEAVCFHLRARERLRDGLRHLSEQVFSPTLLDLQYVPFGHRFGFLSYGVRPIRLACKYAREVLSGTDDQSRSRRGAYLPPD